MLKEHSLSKQVGRRARGLAALTAAVAVAVAGQASAQDKKAAPKDKAAPPAAAQQQPQQAAGKQTAWVKLCEKVPIVKKDKDGKDQKEERNLCLTHHERLDGNTGQVIVSAAIREVEGQDKQSLMIMVPLGMAIPFGVRAAVYTKDQWEKIQKNEKVDEKALKPVELKYSLCHGAGCTAEMEATKELIDQMKAGGGIGVIALHATGNTAAFPIPLDGFSEAMAGAPVDNEVYKKARGELMKQIAQRQRELYEQYKKEAEAKKAAEGGAATTAGSVAPAAAPAAPAAKPAEKKK
jgi:invasion protein IalB